MRRPEICWFFFFRRNFWGPVPLDRLHLFFLRTLSVGGTPLHKLCTWLLLIFFFRRNFWRPLPLDRLHFFFGLCFFLFFGGTPLHKLCTWHLLIFFFGGTQHHKMCSGLLLIQWFSLGFLLFFFFRRNSTSQNVRLSSADLYGFSAEVHKFSNRASLQHFLSLACYWPSCNGCNGRGLEWAWISGHWIQSMPRLIDGL